VKNFISREFILAVGVLKVNWKGSVCVESELEGECVKWSVKRSLCGNDKDTAGKCLGRSILLS